jgi:hypothetical protein
LEENEQWNLSWRGMVKRGKASERLVWAVQVAAMMAFQYLIR